MCEVNVGDIVRSRTLKDLYNEYLVRGSMGIEELFIGDAPSSGRWVNSFILNEIAGREFKIIKIDEGETLLYTLKPTTDEIPFIESLTLDKIVLDNLIIT